MELQVVMPVGMVREQKSNVAPGAIEILVVHAFVVPPVRQSTATRQLAAFPFVIEIIEAERSAVTDVLDLKKVTR
ncbi:MAG TPA: hypothetical protein VIF02_05740 [Methylocella sp.]